MAVAIENGVVVHLFTIPFSAIRCTSFPPSPREELTEIQNGNAMQLSQADLQNPHQPFVSSHVLLERIQARISAM